MQATLENFDLSDCDSNELSNQLISEILMKQNRVSLKSHCKQFFW